MDGQQGATTCNLKELPPPYPWNTHKDDQDEQGHQNAIEHNIHLIHGNETPKHTRESCQQNGGMELEKSFLHKKEQSRKMNAFRDCLDVRIKVRSRLH